VGVALLDGSEEAAELLRLADEAMYADKARRRGA
jgi:GGDEF domain-containing protein